MSVEVFLDTNVLVYAVDSAPTSRAKRDRARELLRAQAFGTSAQVLQEFYVTVTRKLSKPLSTRLAARWVKRIATAELVAIDAVLVKAAIVCAERHKISYWDAAIISAADALGAKTLYSEDLSHQQVYGSVRVVNPFIGR